jgi:predicted MPP superfamily phosphohydrolase
VDTSPARAGPVVGSGSLIFAPKAAASPAANIVVRHFAGHADYARQIEGVRVAHLTDLHVGAVTPHRIQEEAVELTNASGADLVVITGDFVCHSQRYLEELTAVISKFSMPVFGVLGNHDYWSGASEVRRAILKGGGEVLDNANTLVTVKNQRLQLVGLDDAYTGHAERAKAIKGLTPGVATLGLSHIAEEADGLWAAGVPLVLSGHTHAGQVTVAGLNELALGKMVGHRYVHGLYGARANPGPYPGAVYVGAGIGAAVVPLRVGLRAKRELALFDLGVTPGAFAEPLKEAKPLPGRPPTERTKYLRTLQVARREIARRGGEYISE